MSIDKCLLLVHSRCPSLPKALWVIGQRGLIKEVSDVVKKWIVGNTERYIEYPKPHLMVTRPLGMEVHALPL